MASIQPTDAGGFRVSVCKMGVRDSKSFPAGTTHKDAANWGTTREAEIINGEKVKAKTGHTVKYVITEFMRTQVPSRISYEWETGRCKWLLKHLPFVGHDIRAVGVDDIEEWIIDRKREVGGASINRDLQLLGPIFKWAIKKKWLAINVVHEADWPDNPEPREMRISDKHASSIIAALGYVRGTVPVSKSERLAVAFLLALETGMRRGEMLKTLWRNVHPVYVHLPGTITKNRKKRDVALSPEARRLVELLPRHDKTMFGDLSADTADSLFRSARTLAKLPELHFHDTRHEAVTRLARKLEVLPLSRMIGHEDLNSLKRYYNATVQEIAELLEDDD